MFGKLLGDIAETVVKVANVPAEGADRVIDYAMGEEDAEDPGGPRLSSAGETAAAELKRLLETLD